MGPTQCPHCGLLNLPYAATCDCGYDFAAGRAPAPPPEQAPARRRREWRAFAVVPLAATVAWYVLTLIDLAVVNGRLRLRTDVMAMAIGAVVVGLPIAAGATILAMPLYLILRRTPLMTRAAVLTAGGVLGLALASVVSVTSSEWSTLPPWRGLGIGLAGAAAWLWRVGEMSLEHPRRSLG